MQKKPQKPKVKEDVEEDDGEWEQVKPSHSSVCNHSAKITISVRNAVSCDPGRIFFHYFLPKENLN